MSARTNRNLILPLFVVLNGKTFPDSLVDANTMQSVSELRILVKNTIFTNFDLGNDLRNLDAEDFILWRVVFPHPRSNPTIMSVGAQVIQLDTLRKKRKLLAGELVGDVLGGTNYFPTGGMLLLVIEPGK
ncbi:hypothetical protein BGW39_011377 [Mortierella sp. 14UC]|nr:hypothetical protein BGW39_011377 [Mortierella sp. 14UC]